VSGLANLAVGWLRLRSERIKVIVGLVSAGSVGSRTGNMWEKPVFAVGALLK